MASQSGENASSSHIASTSFQLEVSFVRIPTGMRNAVEQLLGTKQTTNKKVKGSMHAARGTQEWRYAKPRAKQRNARASDSHSLPPSFHPSLPPSLFLFLFSSYPSYPSSPSSPSSSSSIILLIFLFLLHLLLLLPLLLLFLLLPPGVSVVAPTGLSSSSSSSFLLSPLPLPPLPLPPSSPITQRVAIRKYIHA